MKNIDTKNDEGGVYDCYDKKCPHFFPSSVSSFIIISKFQTLFVKQRIRTDILCNLFTSRTMLVATIAIAKEGAQQVRSEKRSFVIECPRKVLYD
jgi:hypothetical protein